VFPCGRNVFSIRIRPRSSQAISKIVHNGHRQNVARLEESRRRDETGVGKSVPWKREIATGRCGVWSQCTLGAAWKGPEVKQMGLISSVAEDGDLVLGRDVVEKEVQGQEGRRGDCRLTLSKRSS